MASRKISDLTPNMQTLYLRFATAMREKGLFFTVTCTARTYAEQEALFAQGRKCLADVNALRSRVGLAPITEEANRRKVTWTLRSKHIVHSENEKACAFDIVLLDPHNDLKGHYDLKADVNSDQIPDYAEAGKLGECVGLKWGGHFNDYCHFEHPDDK